MPTSIVVAGWVMAPGPGKPATPFTDEEVVEEMQKIDPVLRSWLVFCT